MPRKKSVDVEVIEAVIVEEVEVPAVLIIEESDAKKEFRKLIEVYAKQNPAKYAQKKEAMDKKLASL